MSKAKFKLVSEWISAGALSSGWAYYEAARETEKAVGVVAERFNAAGNPVEGMAWFPKSQLLAVSNDFYRDGHKAGWLIPAWLLESRRNQGLSV